MKHYIFPILVCALYVGDANATDKSLTLCINPTHFAIGQSEWTNSQSTDVTDTTHTRKNILGYNVTVNEKPESGYTSYYKQTIVMARCDGLNKQNEPVGYGTENPFIGVDDSSDAYCYCKMISPIVSTWFMAPHGVVGATLDSCLTDCSYHCNFWFGQNNGVQANYFSPQTKVGRNGYGSDLVNLNYNAESCIIDGHIPVIRQGVTPAPCGVHETQGTASTLGNLSYTGTNVVFSCRDVERQEATRQCFAVYDQGAGFTDDVGTYGFASVCNEFSE
ncbi:MAG: hypothetical protein IKB05_00860 [Alphaproteobacteria bacterium]|nr:hypothetical protein [Alphaproteobacteria bacterium]